MASIALDTPIESLPMIGESYAKRLFKLNISVVRDLLFHFPHRHEDLSTILPIDQLIPGQTATIRGTVIDIKNIFTKRGAKLQKATIVDETGQIDVTWFNQVYLVETLQKNPQIQLSGKFDLFNHRLSIASPEYESVRPDSTPIHTGRLVPIYPETYGVSSKWLRSRIFPLIKHLPHIADPVPTDILSQENLIPISKAISQIHFPDNHQECEAAKKRLAFDEIFYLQLVSQIRKYAWQSKKIRTPLTLNSKSHQDFINILPFTLTQSQQTVINEIFSDLSQKKPMNRLLQGDVGSGKTVVAAAAMHAAHQNHLKSVMLAPTEILAEQHFQTIKTLLEPLRISCQLITGSTSKKVKQDLSSNSANIIIGTHALLFSDLPKNIGLLIVDEQHRFGVKQRSKLLELSQSPHLLSMTATPIPRTIALSIYGELDLSIIDEMPQGRKPVKTRVVPEAKRQGAYKWIREQMNTKKIQTFVVCPLIDESTSEKLTQVKAVQAEYELLKSQTFSNFNVAMLHGRMKVKEKQATLDDFKAHKSNVLVSTPVIEVGIDIPNANIMLIEAAERFGLAQLHQLRGRVGRGDQTSYCLLFTSDQNSQDISRLKAMEDNHSGFKLAEIDLNLRGPGEMYGLRQHGFSSLKFASFSDQHLVKTTHHYAKTLIQSDPTLEAHPLLKQQIAAVTSESIEPN